MALRVFLRCCLSASARTLSAPAFTTTPPRCHLSAAPLACAALRPPPCARAFSTSPLCQVTFNIQDEDDFQDRVLKSSALVIVDFHAQWCGPCKILAPRLEKLVAKQDGKLLMAKVDIDDHTDLALKYEVSAVPTVVAVKNGAVVDKFVGLKDEDELEAFLKRVVG